MSETRKLTTILVADVAGYTRLAAADEERTLARLRALRSDLVDPAISLHHGRVVKRTGDGILIEFRSVVDAVRCGIEVQNGMAERNAGLAPERQIQFRVGIHLGDVVEEADGDLMGDGVNIAARLESICAPGAICLSEDAYRQVRSRLDLAVIDLGAKDLKNIPEPVHVFSLEVGKPAQAKLAAKKLPDTVEPPRLSIVVLPFANIGGDPEQEYFVDGVTESLTTDLSRISGSFVIARNTAFTYKGKPVDVKQIGQDLNVRYVLEGSVQRGGSRLRVNVQLIEAESGTHVWAERFDKPVADLFDMQDEIVARLARALGVQLAIAEAHRSEREGRSLDSVDLSMRGWSILHKDYTPQGASEAAPLFEQAATLAPANVEALIGLSWTHSFMAVNASDRMPEHVAIASDAASRATAIAPRDPRAHLVHCRALLAQGQPEAAFREVETAITLDPNLAPAYGESAIVSIRLGRAEDAESRVAQAIRLSPRDPEIATWSFFVGYAAYHLGELDRAIVIMQKALDISPRFALLHFILAGALAAKGREAEAQNAVKRGLALRPDFTVSAFANASYGTNATFLAQRARIYDDMRKAGVPEG